MTDLSVDLAGLRLANPLVVSSCSLTADPARVRRLAAAGAGAIVTKTIAADTTWGAPRRFSTGRAGRSLAVATDARLALRDAGAVIDAAHIGGIPVIANVLGRSDDAESWVEICRAVVELGADMIELDLNCAPQGDVLAGLPPSLVHRDVPAIGQDPAATARVVAAAGAAVDVPIVAKLTAAAPDVVAVAVAAAAAGAHVLSGVNALYSLGDLGVGTRLGQPTLPGFAAHAVTPVCGPDLGLLGVKYTALLCSLDLPPYLSGSGVMDPDDVFTRLLLGAPAVTICSVLYLEGIAALPALLDGLTTLLRHHGLDAADVVGLGQRYFVDPASSTPGPAAVCRVIDIDRWADVGEQVHRRSELACDCIRRDGDRIGFDESLCTGCALPCFHAPDGVLAMVEPAGGVGPVTFPPAVH